ncbi:MAG: ABC transporter substrate-binding protein [Polaribacter sp. BACL8 MAG-120531-bin13]|nr:MAG: ABC transporter substrate-binding protein [Polaribacter sp. BACL8 MAG-120531-bin13]KRO99782.1 MAG: ABC transporter substrate-binding protein [Polaribacter sp. BACL8 MAG-120619-bin41]KRP14070.1 MAG: ABC transporter substrate-binding protein [Polaribacter sp. BACL8 MAG-120419-bin8]MBT4840396.1 MCE family protein [Flavobacteriaceae bacterium]MBT5585933.1 MCE family protein [Flavobacteriaceae bacterium]
MNISREIKTGIIGIGGILLFLLGYSYLKSSPLFENNKTLYVVYHHVGGLQPGTAVSINGFTVGKVNDVGFLDASGDLLVTFSVDDSFSFSKNSTAELYDTGIIGGKGIQILPAFDQGPIAQAGDTLIASVKPGVTELLQQQLSPLQNKVEDVIKNADSLLVNINTILDGRTKKDLKQSIESLNILIANTQKTTEVLSNIVVLNRGAIEGSIQNLDSFTENLALVTDSISKMGLTNTFANLAQTAEQLNAILAGIENGEGSLGKLTKDTEMYDYLTQTSKELSLLLQDVRLNPKRYINVSVFGKKQKEYRLPTNDPANKTVDPENQSNINAPKN